MKYNNSNFLPRAQERKIQNYSDAFNDYLNSIYWDGYAEQLIEEAPEAYVFELNQFLITY